MAFNVVIDLVPPADSDLVIGAVHVTGEPDKPNVTTLPGHNTALGDKLHACHVMAWKIMYNGLAQQVTGATLRTASEVVGKLDNWQATNISAIQLKQHMEAVLKHELLKLQENVHNYYVGAGRPNMSAGGKMGAAIQALNALHERYQRSQFGAMRMQLVDYQSQAVNDKIKLFQNGYDESKHHSAEGKVMARGEYVAFWYQIYYGGEPDSTRYAKFLIETQQGQAVIDHLILNGR
jgi:hypothetical protein